MMTPFPVPTHNRFPPISRAVIRTNEKPNFPVPVDQCQNIAEIKCCWSQFCKIKSLALTNTYSINGWEKKKREECYQASCWRRARCPHPEGAGVWAHGIIAVWSPNGWTPIRRLRSRRAAWPGSPGEDERQMISEIKSSREEIRNKPFVSRRIWIILDHLDKNVFIYLFHSYGQFRMTTQPDVHVLD